MSWKFVFRSHILMGNYDNVVKLARASYYKFFTFNGDVYFITKNSEEKTGISIEDLY